MREYKRARERDERREFKVYTRRDVNDVNYGNELLGAEGCIAVKLKYDASPVGDSVSERRP